MKRALLSLIFGLLVSTGLHLDADETGGASNQLRSSGALTPAEALSSFQTETGLRVELVTGEPLTASPCAIAWDERGRMFVAENRGYPTGGPGGQAAGVVAMLEDTNDNDMMDKRTEFATGLTFPNGVMPWRGGLIVTCAPDVFYFKDTDGDGKADVKEILLTGFATNQSTQLRVNKPMLAPDGWVYLASGLSGGKITSPKRPNDSPLELKGDIRFKPDTGEYEPTDGKSQFGQSFDDWGRRFGVFNRVQVQHFVLPSRYVARNPHLPSPGMLQNCPDLIDNPLMRGGGGAARIYPISANLTTADSHAGTFTAACAIHVYRGGALPGEYDGHAFSCDPTGNLVHHDRLQPSGATFAARRARENVEFLRSRDDWFRPVFLAIGPDGALYICDMYRKVIEHPEYFPVEVRKRMDFESGKGIGRIWRVEAEGAKRFSSTQNHRSIFLEATPAKELVAALDSTNEWRRDTAFRLLVERNEAAIVPLLKQDWSKIPSPAGVAARLHLLALLNALDESTLAGALDSAYAGVREVAVKLAETQLARSPNLQARVLKIADDPDARVRFQCALALGEWLRLASAPSESDVLHALVRIVQREAGDKWTRAAALSSIAGRERDFLSAVLSEPSGTNDTAATLLSDLGRVLAGAVPSLEQPALLHDALTVPASDFDGLAALLSGFNEARPQALRAFAISTDPAVARLRELFTMGRRNVADPSAPLSRRVRAASLLAAVDDSSANPVLLERLRAGEPLELQAAAIRALTQPHNPAGARELLEPERWAAYTPALRGTVLGALLSRPEHHAALLDALESGAAPVNAVDSSRREQLKKSKNEALRLRAEKLFASNAGGDRQKAFAEAKACLALKPVPGNGGEVFKRLCSSCHRLEREGVAVGPDLFDIRNQPKEAILLHTVIPELEIAPNFVNYTCEANDGRVLSGLIAAETPASVTLRQAQGIEETIPRNVIVSLTASKLSLMPQELEKGMTPQELADLLGYLKGEP